MGASEQGKVQKGSATKVRQAATRSVLKLTHATGIVRIEQRFIIFLPFVEALSPLLLART